jgi:CobQ/CobB/MinD/ParA nucleotide binding domain
MKPAIRFDDSLPAFAGLVKDAWDEKAIENNLFLRDASGRLTFVLLDESRSKADRESLASKAALELGCYVDDAGFSVATPDELFDDDLKRRIGVFSLNLNDPRFKGRVNFVDRRIVGADWMRSPQPSATAPVRLVFASIKGGVGRSTALCVVAAHFAAHGRRVLAIDMDLEAPGLGNLLLPDKTLPEFGLLDYLVESEAGSSLDEQFFADLIGPSWLGGGRGRVDVVPAIGQRSLRHPANVLAKLARAYLAETALDGQVVTFSDHMRMLVERYADPLRYDIILADARAGLHETTASAVIGLGAEVLLFGLDQQQTFAGFELLFAHLGTLPSGSEDRWQSRLHLVQAKASPDPQARTRFSQRMESLLRRYLWPSEGYRPSLDPATLKDTFEVDWSEDHDPEAIEELISAEPPPPVIAVLDDEQFRSFDPLLNRDVLSSQIYLASFGQLLEMTTTMLSSSAESEENHRD